MPNFGKWLETQSYNLSQIEIHLANQLQYQKGIMLLRLKLFETLNMPRRVVLPNFKLVLWLIVILKSIKLIMKKYLYQKFVMMLFTYFLLLLPKIIRRYTKLILSQHFQLENQMRLFIFEFLTSSNTCLGIMFKFFKVFTDLNKLLMYGIFYLKNFSNLLVFHFFLQI